MQRFSQAQKNGLSTLGKNWGWILAFGLSLFALGILAISFASFTSLVSVVFLGALLTIGGLIVIIDTFRSWWGAWSGFIIHLISGLLYCIVGVMLMSGPALGSISLTLLLAIFYIIMGIFRISYSLMLPLPRKGLNIFNGVVSLILGILILAEWPSSGLFIIGLFVGIDLLIAGWVYIMAAFSVRRLSR